ncbi:2og-Fe oxygenase family protein [Grosmannia clavigera kw1407]|uniref:2og-Fe oxygenase family protein n=1 Tax=Grosmannia clavigera (strain kw1407 / UAMH 11150) TaxID=655863 RepID=F0XBG1_GROCL|nr:2og-Fe oxygenase family protein [Grosmannia clavigera kw1407]EFX04999.1 2og-Fe oxygenase family protein [Grosmannia clavigera kw1407]
MAAQIALIDFSGFYSDDAAKKKAVVDQIRTSCLHNGFFQIVGHSVPLDQQKAVMDAVKRFFALPQADKDAVSKNNNTWNRGYEMLRSQILEEGTEPELKEGFYIGDEIAETHPYFVQRRLNSGPNQWPAALGADLASFQSASMNYYQSALGLAADLLRALALSMDLPEDYFGQFMQGAVATMRYLHYPSQPADADEKLARGIGAHTDFGAITLLLQDTVDGLQVLDAGSHTWIDVEPTPGALVVNLGNLMQRWTNERYRSNIHRVINKSGKERYSIPVFISGNPDYVVDCIPTCLAPGDAVKFPPITVEAAVSASYAESYGRAQLFKAKLAGSA